MKHRARLICLFSVATAILLAGCQLDGGTHAGCTAPAQGCTVFTVSKGGQVFFGGNDDNINPDSYYWVEPGNETRYGAIWIGVPDNVQQGVNEKGLAYDANGLPRVEVNPHRERESVSGEYGDYLKHIMHECATVEEVINWVNTHQRYPYMHDQMQFADASGDAVVISAGADGEMIFTRKPAGDGFLVSTNFNVANPANGYGYPCPRYQTATKRLGRLVEQEDELTVADAAAVLQAVSVDGGTSWTLESMVADLTRGVVYLYYFRQFDKPVVLNVVDELTNPRPAGPLSKLFPDGVRQEATRRYQEAISRRAICTPIGKVWAGAVALSLILAVAFTIQRPRTWLYWLPIVLFLGPLGLLILLAAGRKPRAGAWRAALIEAGGDALPVLVIYILFVIALLLNTQSQYGILFQVLVVLVLPFLCGWLFFHGPMLALGARQGYLRTLGQRAPVAWVVASLAIGGIQVLATPLINLVGMTCSVMPATVWLALTIWAAAVAGGSVAVLLIWVYECWAVRRGYHAWSVLAWGEGQLASPPWRKVWWWILVSYAVLVAAFVVSQALQNLLAH